MEDVHDDDDDVFVERTLSCGFCKREGGSLSTGYHAGLLHEDRPSFLTHEHDFIGPFRSIPPKEAETDSLGKPVMVHRSCAIWAPRVFIDVGLRIRNVPQELGRATMLRCRHCKKSGAAVGCFRETCPQSYHLPCAKEALCYLDYKRFMLVCKDCFVDFMYAQFPQLPRDYELTASQKYQRLIQWRDKTLVEESLQTANNFDEESFLQTIIGLETYFKEIKEALILPLIYPDLFSKFGIQPARGILLHGSPGCGKTHLARSLFSYLEKSNFRINGKPITVSSHLASDLLSKFYGETERNIRDIFSRAREQEPAILFFDEFDALAAPRSAKQMQIHSSVVTTFLTLMDGIHSAGKVFVVAATNRKDRIDPAFLRPGRFDKDIKILPLNIDTRSKVFFHTIQNWREQIDLDDDTLSDFVRLKCSNFSVADLKSLCADAILYAVRRAYPDAELTKLNGRRISTVEIKHDDLLRAYEGIRNRQSSLGQSAWHFGPERLAEIPWNTLFDDQVQRIHEQLKSWFAIPPDVKYFKSYMQTPRYILLHGSSLHAQNLIVSLVVRKMQENFCSDVDTTEFDFSDLFMAEDEEAGALAHAELTALRNWRSKLQKFTDGCKLLNGSKPNGRILLLKSFDTLWKNCVTSLRCVIQSDLQSLSLNISRVQQSLEHILVIVTTSDAWNGSFAFQHEVPLNVFHMFSKYTYRIRAPSKDAVKSFVNSLYQRAESDDGIDSVYESFWTSLESLSFSQLMEKLSRLTHNSDVLASLDVAFN